MNVDESVASTYLSNVRQGDVFRFSRGDDYFLKGEDSRFTNLRNGFVDVAIGDPRVISYPDAVLVPGKAS